MLGCVQEHRSHLYYDYWLVPHIFVRSRCLLTVSQEVRDTEIAIENSKQDIINLKNDMANLQLAIVEEKEKIASNQVSLPFY